MCKGVNNYLQDEKVISKSKTAKYLKDVLFYNSRHTNYELYKSLKKSLSEFFSVLTPHNLECRSHYRHSSRRFEINSKSYPRAPLFLKKLVKKLKIIQNHVIFQNENH
jgi:hypothetical protein